MSDDGRSRGYLVDSVRELWYRPKHQVPALDAIRAAAVLVVVIGHFFNTLWRQQVRLPQPPMADGLIFFYGWTGVDLFFILSGYLIGAQLWREKKKTGTIQVWHFIIRRGFRIWPLYYALIILGTLAGVMHPKWPDLLFLSNYVPGGYSRGWTLSTEEQFYIAVPLLLAFTPWVKKLTAYFWVFGAVVVSVWINRHFACDAVLQTGLASCQQEDAMLFPIHLHNEALLAGLCIALLATVRPQYFDRKAGDGVSWRGLAVMLVSFVLAVVLHTVNKMIFTNTTLALIFGSTTLWLLWDRSVLSWPASWRIWYPVSRLSYGMYLNHFFLLSGITGWVTLRAIEVTGSVHLAAYVGIVTGVLVSMAFAAVTFVCVERPFLLLRARWIASQKDEEPSPPRLP